ncbi:hypothetical protein BJX70DRAFT_376796 [Aspergillus crustosus]
MYLGNLCLKPKYLTQQAPRSISKKVNKRRFPAKQIRRHRNINPIPVATLTCGILVFFVCPACTWE